MPGDRFRFFIIEKPGRIRVVENGTLLATPFLDISGPVNDNGNEQGLLSMAFDPDYQQNGIFYGITPAAAAQAIRSSHVIM